jgi:hypothetical protein
MNCYSRNRWWVVSLFAIGACTQFAFCQEVSETPAAASAIGTRPSYPGLPRGQASKLETEIGPMKVRFYGTILFNSSISTASAIGRKSRCGLLPMVRPQWPIRTAVLGGLATITI